MLKASLLAVFCSLLLVACSCQSSPTTTLQDDASSFREQLDTAKKQWARFELEETTSTGSLLNKLKRGMKRLLHAKNQLIKTIKFNLSRFRNGCNRKARQLRRARIRLLRRVKVQARRFLTRQNKDTSRNKIRSGQDQARKEELYGRYKIKPVSAEGTNELERQRRAEMDEEASRWIILDAEGEDVTQQEVGSDRDWPLQLQNYDNDEDVLDLD